MIAGKTGIVENKGREQPFTVWFAGHTIRFCVTAEEAGRALADAAEHERRKLEVPGLIT